MSTADHSTNCLLTDLFGRDLIDTQPKLSSIQRHEDFIKSIALPSRSFDSVDLELDDLAGDPAVESFGRPRKESQANRVLAILDDLERSGG